MLDHVKDVVVWIGVHNRYFGIEHVDSNGRI